MKPLHKYSKGYQMLRNWVKFTLQKLFLRKVEIRGLEKIDPKKPIILAPNHQNALLDALLVTTSLKQQPVFLARADIFEKPIIVKILRYFKMLPVYRIRDGFDSLKKNEEIFEQCVDYLGENSTLILFPEGNHGDKRHFRPLKKGLARIAFEAEKKNDFNLGLQVIPVGIDYSDYRKFRSKATIIIGDPIEMHDFKALHEENPQKGMRQLNLAISKGIEPNMIEIPWMDQYESVMKIRTIFGDRFHRMHGSGKKSLIDKFYSHKKLIEIIGKWIEDSPDEVDQASQKLNLYFDKLRKLNIRDHVVKNQPYSYPVLFFKSLMMVLLLPVYLLGLINNYIIFRLPDYYSAKKIKDSQFKSSIAYVLAFVLLLPILYTIQTILVAVFTPTWWIPVLYLISLIPAGLFAIYYSFMFKKLRSRWKFKMKNARNDPQTSELIKLRQELTDIMDSITERSSSLH